MFLRVAKFFFFFFFEKCQNLKYCVGKKNPRREGQKILTWNDSFLTFVKKCFRKTKRVDSKD